MKRKLFLIQILIVGFVFAISAQSPAKYWVHFKDKANSPYSINRPQEFLSQRAIDLRSQHHIAIMESDLPVNPSYVAQVLSVDSTMRLFTASKWLNGVTVYSEDENALAKIQQLPCVDYVERTIQMKEVEVDPLEITPAEYSFADAPMWTYYSDITDNHDFDYGRATDQIRINNGHWLHRLGFRGEKMRMMILDGGFSNVDTLRYFTKLREDGRFLGARNMVQATESPLRRNTHGTMVLSCIAAYIPGEIVGTAPMIQAFLCKTEDGRSENRIEEDNWVAGVELADSLGCQVLNSSLGYTKFDDTLNVRKHSDLDGITSRASQAATIAATKGLIICNSAGNEGAGKWRKIGCPADSKDILTVGAINDKREKAVFSSFGPTADGRVKPDACAVGRNTVVGYPNSKTVHSNGTSFSSPVLSGMVTCLWQAFPEKSNYEVMQAVRMSGDRFTEPDSAYGYGIPDFLRAYNYLRQPALNIISDNGTFKGKDWAVRFDGGFVAMNGAVIANITNNSEQKIAITTRVLGQSQSATKIYTIKKEKSVKIKLPALSKNAKYQMVEIEIECGNDKMSFVVGQEASVNNCSLN